MANINDVMQYNGAYWTPSTVPFSPGFFGDGLDSLITYAVNTTLTADVRGTIVVIDPGVTVIANGFEISATVSVTNNGILSADGGDAVAAVPGTGGGNNTSTSGVQGGDGGARTVGGTDCNANGAAMTAEARGASGGNGAGAGAGLGGTNASFTVDTSFRSPLMGPDFCWVKGYAWDLIAQQPYVISCGAGGGGGNAGSGGVGGGGAGGIRVRAPLVANNGVFTARGGHGSAATGANGSGGGGGGAGWIIVGGKRTGSGTYVVTGGLGGAGNGTGTAGSPGANGTLHFFG